MTNVTSGEMRTHWENVSTRLQAIEQKLNGTLDTQVTGSKAQLAITDASDSSLLDAGTTNTVTILSASGTIAKLEWIFINIPAPTGATTGNHRVIVGIEDTLTRSRFIELNSPFSEPLTVGMLQFSGNAMSHSIESPAMLREFLGRGVHFGDIANKSFRVTYHNNTDVTQSNTRMIRVRSIQEAVIQ
ncbi:hypothetical protein [Halalkalibacterium ligniniphilum]|uniref:hypothetical protein n=1 Tax=Halalkalibacterium ligniniphilum TaxID=1134413 RepID=UPI00036B8E01|nr:hypothetical protein [Halalkalibacterium ligniniphilum]